MHLEIFTIGHELFMHKSTGALKVKKITTFVNAWSKDTILSKNSEEPLPVYRTAEDRILGMLNEAVEKEKLKRRKKREERNGSLPSS